MVSPELKQAFAQRNIETIPVEVGAHLLVEELAPENQAIAQVIIGSPLLPAPAPLGPELKHYRIQRRLSLHANPFLQDHVISGRPVLPAACAMAWMITACERLYPGYQFFNYTDFKVLKGIVFDDSLASEYLLDLEETTKIDGESIQFLARIWSRNSAGKPRYHFSTHITLQRQIPEAPNLETFDLNPDRATQIPGVALYQTPDSGLFHGKAFQGVQQVLNLTPERITMECNLVALSTRDQGQFPVHTFNPYIIDVEIHSLLIWLQHFHQAGCLPSHTEHYQQFSPIPFDQTFYISTTIRSRTDTALVADVMAHDRQGRVYSRMVGAKGTVLPLNKIANPAAT